MVFRRSASALTGPADYQAGAAESSPPPSTVGGSACRTRRDPAIRAGCCVVPSRADRPAAFRYQSLVHSTFPSLPAATRPQPAVQLGRRDRDHAAAVRRLLYRPRSTVLQATDIAWTHIEAFKDMISPRGGYKTNKTLSRTTFDNRANLDKPLPQLGDPLGVCGRGTGRSLYRFSLLTRSSAAGHRCRAFWPPQESRLASGRVSDCRSRPCASRVLTPHSRNRFSTVVGSTPI